ncbi:MAG: hypothetical protein EB020_15470 [Proteobacteria bacterium]|nr:hypothetical protein [Pseudomonadota bacterium]NDF94823.1 hypothetical protein [Pseudomonadota bacterium]
MTATRLQWPATIPRLWVIRRSDIPVSRLISSRSSSICACTVASRAVVGSSAMRTAGSQAIARAIITR